MKRFFVALFVLSLLCSTVSAQSRALGIRVGGDIEASYQHSFSDNFLELDLGLAFIQPAGFQISGIYDFVFATTESFSFYAGPGAQLNTWRNPDKERRIGLGIGGQVGAEYHFATVPFNISLDWRPMWNFVGAYCSWGSLAASFRYRF